MIDQHSRYIPVVVGVTNPAVIRTSMVLIFTPQFYTHRAGARHSWAYRRLRDLCVADPECWILLHGRYAAGARPGPHRAADLKGVMDGEVLVDDG